MNEATAGQKPTRAEPARLSRRKKLAFSATLILVLLAAFEFVLFLCGVKPPCYAEDPYVGFASWVPHFIEKRNPSGQIVMTTAPGKLKHFNRQSFLARKPEGVYRIFCVGGSTTYGRPFFDDTSFPGWLRAFLPVADPSRNWEVVNAGGLSYASYRVTGVMEELCQYEPDLFIVYIGHNEFLERRTYGQILDTPAGVRNALSLLNRTRTATAIQRALHAAGVKPGRDADKPIVLPAEIKAIPVNAVGPEAYVRDDSWKQQVVQHFRLSLDRMVDIAESAGARILFITPASNLRHFSPFKSEHKPGLGETDLQRWSGLYQKAIQLIAAGQDGEALDALRQAEAIDDRYADLHFRKGQVLCRLQQYPQAKECFVRAREEDICPLRALGSTCRAVREVAAAREVGMVDFAAILEERAEHGIPGEEFFADHVHPTVSANRLLALSILETLMQSGTVRPGDSWNQAAIVAATRSVHEGIDRKAHAGELRALASMLDWLGQEDQALKRALEALDLSEGAPESLYLVGLLRQKQGATELAAEDFRKAVATSPEFAEAHCRLGIALSAMGLLEEAAVHLEKAASLKPDLASAHEQLGIIAAKQGDLNEALLRFSTVVRLTPDSPEAQNNLGLAFAELGRYDDAMMHYTAALRLRPGFTSSHYNLALALEQLDRPETAAQHYREVLRLAPDHVNAAARLRNLRDKTR